MGTEGKLSPADLALRLSTLAIPAVIQGVAPGTIDGLAFNGLQA